MNRLKSIIKAGAVAIMLLGTVQKSQGQDKQPDNPKSASQTSKELKKKQWQRQREINRATKKALKAHMKHQTKAVRKRMKKDAKRANDYNSDTH